MMEETLFNAILIFLFVLGVGLSFLGLFLITFYDDDENKKFK